MIDLVQKLRDRAAAHGGDKLLEDAAAVIEAHHADQQAEALREIQNNAARPTPTPGRDTSR